MPRPRLGANERAVRKALVPARLASPLGQVAVTLARRLDNPDTHDRDAAALARVLAATLKELAAEQPTVTRRDDVDELSAKRDRRRASAGGESAP